MIPTPFNPLGANRIGTDIQVVFGIDTPNTTIINALTLQTRTNNTECIIEWGDGTAEKVVLNNVGEVNLSHTYTADGEYFVRIYETNSHNIIRTTFYNQSVKCIKRVFKIVGNGIESLNSCFYNQINLVGNPVNMDNLPKAYDIGAMYRNTKISGQPADMSRLISLQQCSEMYAFSKISGQPADLSNNINIRSTISMYYQCTGLTGSPVDMSMLTSLSNATYMYFGCTNLTGNALPVINSAPASLVNHAQMFTGDTKLSDYAEIPAGWK